MNKEYRIGNVRVGKDEAKASGVAAGLAGASYAANRALNSHLRKSMEMKHGLNPSVAKKLDSRNLNAHYKLLRGANQTNSINNANGVKSSAPLKESVRSFKKARIIKGLGTASKIGALASLGYAGYGIAKRNNAI